MQCQLLWWVAAGKAGAGRAPDPLWPDPAHTVSHSLIHC